MSTPVPSPMAAYHRFPTARVLSTRVLRVDRDDRGPFLLLERSLLYADGGGQPADHGTVGGVAVVDVRRVDGQSRHYVDDPARLPAEGARVELKVDWARRLDHMQQHSAQHLLSALAEDRLGYATTSFHPGPRQSDIELSAPRVTDADLRALQRWALEAIDASRPIRAHWVEPGSPDLAGARRREPRGGLRGPVRLVEIEGLDRSACGGTHVRHTQAIQALALLGAEPMRGGTRVTWLAGGRVVRRLAEANAVLGDLRRALGAPDDGLAAAADRLRREGRDADRARQDLLDALADRAAAGLAARAAGPLCERLGDPFDRARLKRMALALASVGRTALLILPAGADAGGHWALSAPDAIVAAAIERGMADLTAWLDGRGGGRAPLFQGTFGPGIDLSAAEAWLAANVP